MATATQGDFEQRRPLSPQTLTKAVSEGSRPPVLMHDPLRGTIPPPPPPPPPVTTTYRYPPQDTTTTPQPRPTPPALPPLMNGKSSAQGPAYASAAPPNKPSGACTHSPSDSSMRLEPIGNGVTSSSSCQSHGSALDNNNPPQPWKRPLSSTPLESGLRGAYDNDDTSSRHHEDVYDSEMKLKTMAYPLTTPSTVRIGDVGVVQPGGSFHKYFNICEPSELPPYFQPLNCPIRPDDVCTYLAFEPHTFITSQSIGRCEEQIAGIVGSRFRTAASQGAILALPAGGLRTELREIIKFRDFISNNIDNWARFLRDVNRTGELRLVTGHLCAPYWGIATFKGNKDPNLNLLFTQSTEKDKRYVWQGPPTVKTTLSGKLRFSRPSDTLAVTGFTISPRASIREDDRMAVDGPPVSVSRSTLTSGESGVNRVQRHPCDFINERLLALTKVKAAVSHERDWCAVLEQSETAFPEEGKLIQRVFASNEVLNNEGIAYLQWKPKRVETATAADLLKDIDTLRDKLDEIGDTDLVKRAETLHSITTNILTYLKVCKNKDPRDFNFLLSIAASNVVEEVKIMTNLKKDRAPSLHLYASTMWARYQVSGEHKYLESSIQYWHKALEVDPRHADAMADLASALWMRYARFQQVQDLNEVIILYRALLFSQLSNNPGYSNWLNAIGLALWDRYKRTKQMNDMDHAISYFRQASLSYPYPCDAGTLSNLGNILMAKARAFKDTSESDEAISCYRRALESVSALYEHRSALLCNLGDALSYRYDRRCLIADLNEAIRSYERALDLPSPHHRDRVTQLLVFSQRLQARYNSTADSEDLENAIKRLSEAKRLASPSHPKYAAVVETLVLAQRDYDTLRRSRPDYASPPPSSTAASPTLDNSHIPTLRPTSWDTPGPSATSAHIPGVTSVAPSGPPPSYRSSPKTFRIVGRSHTMKPYNRPTSNARGDSSASDDSESSSSRVGPRFLPHPVHASVARAKSPQYHRVGGPPPRRATMPVNGHGHALP